ncbi:MAG: hypothetical protein JXB32_03460, partial [Deltaproteobacteria bacterium]|nr:hypothetical protein [Deltaproteobacteria bacterium]
FLGGLARRPGWYIDTVAVSTSLLEGLPRLDGDPNLPGCGFGASQHAGPAFEGTLPDPCVMGQPVLPLATILLDGLADDLQSDEGDLSAPGVAETEFELPGDGAVCMVVTNGGRHAATRVATGSVLLDGVEVIPSERFNRRATILRQRASLQSGRHKIRVVASPQRPTEAGSGEMPEQYYAFQVLFQPGDAMPKVISSAQPNSPEQGATWLANAATAVTSAGRRLKLEAATRVPGIGQRGQDHVLSYVVQIADPRTCRQVRAIRSAMPIPTEAVGGIEEALASGGITWDGKDEFGRNVAGSLFIVRILGEVGLAGIEILADPAGPPTPPDLPEPPPRAQIPPIGPFSQEFRVPERLWRWTRLLGVPHVGPWARSEACAVSENCVAGGLCWSCAPNAHWQNSAAPPGYDAFWVYDRLVRVTGYFPDRPRDYHARFTQDDLTREEWLRDGLSSEPLGWWMEVPLPAVGDALGTVHFRPGPARLQVYDGSGLFGLPKDFEFQPPELEGHSPSAQAATSTEPAGWTRGDPIRLHGRLLATYRASVRLEQEVAGGHVTSGTWGPFIEEDLPAPFLSTLAATIPLTAEHGPASLVGESASPGTSVAGPALAIEIVSTCPNWDDETDPLVYGWVDQCLPFSGTLIERRQDPWTCEAEVVRHVACSAGCSMVPDLWGSVWPYLRPDVTEVEGSAACLCTDTDFGNPFQRGVFDSGTGPVSDHCDPDTGELVELDAPESCSLGVPPATRRIRCAHGCEAGACRCGSSPSPIVFGCLPFDWPYPPAGEEDAYRAAFDAACRYAIGKFAKESGMDEHGRCYRVKTMWFPEHWAELYDSLEEHFVGSDPAPGNPGWEHRDRLGGGCRASPRTTGSTSSVPPRREPTWRSTGT